MIISNVTEPKFVCQATQLDYFIIQSPNACYSTQSLEMLVLYASETTDMYNANILPATWTAVLCCGCT